MILCNSRYRELYPSVSDVIAPGITFSEIVNTAAERGTIKEAIGRTEAWLERRLAQHRDPKGPHLQAQSDGRWIQINERKTRDGGTVTVFTDITETKRREQELDRANRDLDLLLQEVQSVLDTMDYGVLMIGPDQHLRLANRAFRELWGLPESFLASKPSVRELIEFNRSSGLYAVAEEDFDDYVKDRLEMVRKGDPTPVEFLRGDGKILQYRVQPLPGDGRMMTYFDITSLKRREAELAQKSELLEATLEHVDQGICMLNPELEITACNRRFREILDIPESEITLGDKFEDLIRFNAARGEYGESDANRVVLKRLALVRRRKPFSFRRVRPNGTVVEVSGKPVPGGGTLTTYTDMTEQTRAEQSLRASEAIKASILESALDCVIAIDADGNVVEFNPAAEKTFGYDAKQIVGKPMVELIIPPRMREAHRAGLKRYVETGKSRVIGRRVELSAIRADGAEFPIELAITASRVRDRQIVTAYLRDITERRRAEAALEQAKAIAAEAEARLSDAIENMSEAVVVYDSDNRFVLSNRNFQGALRLRR